MRTTLFLFCLSLSFFACEPKEEITPNPLNSGDLYFPPINSNSWETTNPESLNWNTAEILSLLELLENGGTRAFIVLKDGKIVIEEYFGKDLLGITNFNKDRKWYWASASKTLTAATIGIAQQEGLLNINDKTSDYLGQSWTSLSTDKEDKITIWNQLTMTTGLDDKVADNSATTAEQLLFETDAGNRWAYHNAPYTLLQNVITNGAGQSFETYYNKALRDKIGMDGDWEILGNNHVYFSTGRSMARYGLLILNSGNWAGNEIIPSTFVEEMISPSQNINKSYGYLWWLNGKESFMLPGLQIQFSSSITPNAPDDMVSGVGANGQYLCVIPSQNMVIIRMGENPDNSLVPVDFINKIWEKLNKVIE